MERELGTQRATTLKDSGVLHWDPCPLTKSEAEHMRIYKVPEVFRDIVTGSSSLTTVKSTSEADEADLKTLEGIAKPDANVDLPTEVKQEESGDAPALADPIGQEIEKVKNNARPHLRELQEMETSCKVMSARAETQEYTADFQKYIAAHESKLKSAIKILNNIIEHKPIKPNGLPMLVKLLGEIKTKWETLIKWGSRFDCVSPASKRRRVK